MLIAADEDDDDEEFSYGRISLPILQQLLPKYLLLGGGGHSDLENANCADESDPRSIVDSRLCCICGPILFTKEAHR